MENLVACEKCGNEISPNAIKCPKCKNPTIQEKTSNCRSCGKSLIISAQWDSGTSKVNGTTTSSFFQKLCPFCGEPKPFGNAFAGSDKSAIGVNMLIIFGIFGVGVAMFGGCVLLSLSVEKTTSNKDPYWRYNEAYTKAKALRNEANDKAIALREQSRRIQVEGPVVATAPCFLFSTAKFKGPIRQTKVGEHFYVTKVPKECTFKDDKPWMEITQANGKKVYAPNYSWFFRPEEGAQVIKQ